MIFEELSVQSDSELGHIHVNDFNTIVDSREGERRSLAFIAAKLGSKAMREIELGDGLDTLSQNDFDLAA